MICPKCGADLRKNGQDNGKQLWIGHAIKGCSMGRPPVEPDPTPEKRLDRHRQKQGVTPRVCRYAVWANGQRVGTVEARSVFGARKLAGGGTEVKLIPKKEWENAN
jgi:hypothetical protein